MMMRLLKYFSLLLVAFLLYSCNNEDQLTPSDESLFPEREDNAITRELDAMFGRYNTRVEYRYIRNLIPNDWYYITPAREELVIPVARVLLDMWVGSLIAGSDTVFVERNFPRMIYLVGSPAKQLDGSVVLGQAEGGSLIRFTDINAYRTGEKSWLSVQLNTAFHEYAHILHQTFNMPEAFRQVTPNDYTKNGWMALASDPNQAIIRGMVTPYGSSTVQEDFAEIFANYVMQDEELVNVLFFGEEIVLDQEEFDKLTNEQKMAALQKKAAMEAGCVKIAKKFKILKEHLLSAGLDVTKVRAAFQKQLNDE